MVIFEYTISYLNTPFNKSIYVQVHYFTKEMVYVGMTLLNYLSIDKVDKLMLVMSKLMYGDLSKYGLVRPKEGPFAMKFSGGRTPTVDVGCIKRIKKGKVKVYILLFFFLDC
jgi:indole-3-pyruvate monooxygenase